MPIRPFLRFSPCAAILAAALLTCVAGPARAGDPQELEVPTLGGAQFRLQDARGQVVLVHFWASWCATCKEEMGALEAYYGAHAAQGMQVISPSLDRGRDMAEVHKTMHAFNLPVAMLRQATKNSFGTPAILPVTYVIDARGEIAATMRPDSMPVTAENLARVVGPLLEATKRP
jgi:peroxiredoxin